MIYVFDIPCAMPRYYRDKFYTNPHDKAMIQKNAMDYSERHPSVPCPIQHERLIKKLNKKHR